MVTEKRSIINDHQLKAGGFNSFGGLNHRLKEKTSRRRWFCLQAKRYAG